MSRPFNKRIVQRELKFYSFKPRGIPSQQLDTVTLNLDEMEAIILSDLEARYQEAAARELEVSRATYGRILASAHAKIADALVNGKALIIDGGPVELCKKRIKPMKVAIAVNANQIEEHFGQCKKISIFDLVPGQKIPSASDFPLAADLGCRSGIASALAKHGVTHLIASGIGTGVRNAFESHGIAVFAGVNGQVDAALEALANGSIKEGATTCAGHHEGHEHGEHHHSSGGGCCQH